MIEQRFLKCGVAAVFLFGFAQACLAADTDASAPPAPAIHAPTGDWTVGQLSAMNTNGLGYCSMKNNFQTGQSLVFARDDQGSNSIALDFHKNIFKSGELYNVKARVGAVTRRLDALAATRQVLVMQTGIDTELYSALSHRHNVVFTVNKTNYGFELDASAADALNALRHCSESFQGGTQFSQATFPLGKVSDVAALEQADEEDNVAAIADDEQADQQPAPAKKKHHQHKHIAKAAVPVEAQQTSTPIVAISDAEASAAVPSATQQDTVRDDVKAEIASEIINLRTNEQQPQGSSKGSLPSIMPAAGGSNTAAAALAPIRMASAESADLRSLLQRSRVASGQQIQTAANGALRWTSDDLYGSARQMPLAPGKSLMDVANEYLLKAASVCKGEFAKKVAAPQKAGLVDVLQADITCLDGQNNAAAAVLFIGNKEGRISVITQEGTIDQLTSAMAARDAIISAAAHKGV